MRPYISAWVPGFSGERVTMLMTPAEAPSPYSTEPVPRMISIRSIEDIGTADHCTDERSMSERRRPSRRIKVFCPPVTPKPRISTEVLTALFPKKSCSVIPTCSARRSGTVRAALLAISSEESTVTLAGSLRASSGKRVARTCTTSSVCE